jgi:glucan phosphoethanolaminetransferase (alkaline phosphatase superfamily)
MIQRKQTIWLLLAAILSAGLFLFDLYHYDTVKEGITITQHVRINDDFLSLLLAIVITALPFISIFLFKNRTQQKTFVLLSMVANIAFIAYMLYRVSATNSNISGEGTSAPVNGTYWIGAVLPVVAFIFLIMAFSGIRKDEKLVKSLDRLR